MIADYMKQKAQNEKGNGLDTLFKVLGGTAMGLISGGPIGALVGMGSSALNAASGMNVPTGGIQSALEKFNAWRQMQEQAGSGGWTNFNWTPGG